MPTTPRIRALLDALLDILFPWTSCAACRKDTDTLGGLCPECAATLRHFDHLPNIGAAYPAYAAYHYGGAARPMILHMKRERSGESDIARFLAPAMAALIRKHALDGVLVPVPLHHLKHAARGFNQSEALARRISALTGLPVSTRMLIRVRNTRQQKRLPLRERAENVRDAFTATTHARGNSIILIDDVVTTGATIRECADALMLAGAARVVILSACAKASEAANVRVREKRGGRGVRARRGE